ncbi:hypothetical protein P154DRAFT_571957 [Amniculicola lignicola CBS 123094]|uniref:Uncharacterized protein n=1 Tax=Amniculicola lignicola CBS 123094 TaxID=1392246 RepID=A0A6A5WUW7_9PLEO|nr:hypothetical protein P154DRAFT_571957 [Amniculicola lignicola CBS 123094]
MSSTHIVPRAPRNAGDIKVFHIPVPIFVTICIFSFLIITLPPFAFWHYCIKPRQKKRRGAQELEKGYLEAARQVEGFVVRDGRKKGGNKKGNIDYIEDDYFLCPGGDLAQSLHV